MRLRTERRVPSRRCPATEFSTKLVQGIGDKAIGFIDHYLNNFHANTYVDLIREGRHGGEFDVRFAYGEVECEGVDSEQWCRERGIELLATPEEVVDKSDCLMVLSPNNPERHLDLSRAALGSGKPTYVDKTFAPDLKTAVALVRMARESHTPMFSTSALRYVPEISEHLNGVGKDRPSEVVAVRGPSSVDIYAVHMIEPMVMLPGHGAQSVCGIGGGKYWCFHVRYPDSRVGAFSLFEPGCAIGDKWYGHPFEASVMFADGATSLHFNTADMFRDLVDSICEFYKGGPQPAPFEDTLEVMAIIEAGRNAMSAPGQWVGVPELE